MEDHKDRKFIDDLLDASVAQYRGVEPRPGLENRVLAQLRAEPKASPWLAWARWAGAGLAAVGLILELVSIAYRQRPRMPVSVTQSPRPTATSGFGTRGSGFGKEHERRTPKSESGVSPDLLHASTSRATPGGARRPDVLSRAPNSGPRTPAFQPRRDVFPSPAPLSEEEKLLVSYVRQIPQGVRAAFPEDDQPLASLTVPDLNIPPLEMKELPSTITDHTK